MTTGHAGACADSTKRQFLISSAALVLMPWGLVSACSDAAEIGDTLPKFSPLSAHFVVPGAGQVHLDFEDMSNFALTADAGPGSTVALGERIYLYIAPSIASLDGGRLLLTGALAPLEDRVPLVDLAFEPLQSSHAEAHRWRDGVELMQVEWLPSFPDFTPGTLTVAQLPELAAAQLVISRRLRRGMNMAMCGDAIGRVIATWPESVTARGYAVLAHSLGVELSGPVAPLTNKIALPADLPVEDYRLG